MSASILGRKHLGSISVTDYNPIIEDQRTGRMIAEFFYNTCVGICLFEQNLVAEPAVVEDEEDQILEQTIKKSDGAQIME